jgi:hypothetical protein
VNDEFNLNAIILQKRQIPEYTDDQVRDMMKGKSIAERKRLLKEIEDQRQKQL